MAEPLVPAGIADRRGVALDALGARLDGLDLAPLLIYRLEDVPDDALPLLAWQFHVMGDEGWHFVETPAARRELIRRAIELHRYKGTPWAVRRAAESTGFRVIAVVEGLPVATFDGVNSFAGAIDYGDPLRWAEFRVDLELGEQRLLAADVGRVRRLVDAYKNARSHLDSVGFRLELTGEAAPAATDDGAGLAVAHGEVVELFAPAIRYDGTFAYDGAGDYAADNGVIAEEVTVDVVPA
jgi:phage tail P2-like protein